MAPAATAPSAPKRARGTVVHSFDVYISLLVPGGDEADAQASAWLWAGQIIANTAKVALKQYAEREDAKASPTGRYLVLDAKQSKPLSTISKIEVVEA